MKEPTARERNLAARLGLEAAAVAAARDALNRIASLPWPRPERVSLLSRLARAAGADVGKVLSGLAIDAAPLAGLDALVPLPGLGYKRVAGLARALFKFDPATLTSDDVGLAHARATIAALRGENDLLRKELDRLRAALPGGSTAPPPQGSAVMRISDVASSIAGQVALVDGLLRSRPAGLRLGGVDLHVRGTGTAVGDDVALDLGSPAGGSAVGISFLPGRSEGGDRPEAPVPDVIGYTPALAERKLLARGFAVTVTRMSGARGTVLEQLPPPGTTAPAGSVVRLIVREPGALVFEPPPGSFRNSIAVTIRTSSSSATIRYTTDGTDPTATTGMIYAGPITLSAATQLRARVFRAAITEGDLLTGDYTRAAPAAAPTFHPAPGTFTNTVAVAISTVTPAATIRYTVDGTEPTRSHGMVYSGAVTLSATTTVKARAFSEDSSDSAVASANYVKVSVAPYSVSGGNLTTGIGGNQL